MSINIPEKICLGSNTEWSFSPFKFDSDLIKLGSALSYQNIVLSGVGALTLSNALANGLNYLKLFGGTELLPETYIDSVTAEGKCEQNGTPTPSSPVDIYCNNGVIKLNNVHNIATDTLGAYINKSTGIIVSSTGYGYTDYIPVTAGQVFKITQRGTSTTDADGVNQYNSNKVWQSGQSISALGGTYTVPNGISYISLNFNMTYQQFVIEDGIYVDGTTETITDNQGNVATCQNLLSVGTYKDTQEILSGAVTRNIGIKVLDGTETWTKGSSVIYSDNAITDFDITDNYAIYCTHFLGVDNSSAPEGGTNSARVYKTSTNNMRLGFYPVMSDYATAQDFADWLADQYAQGTPVIVVYPTSSATTESVSGQQLNKTPLTYSGSVSGLTGTVVESSHTTPTPTQPLQLNCNNGVVKHNGLPEGYTRVEYIQSSGTQYIDTGISGNATIKITAQASTIKGSSQALLSSTPTAQGGTWFGEFTTNQKWGIGSGDGLSTIAPTTKMTAELTFNGSGCSGTINNESVTRSATITQGAWTIGAGVSGTTLNYPFSGKIWECQITQNNTIVRNFIPCKNPSNVIGMYDTVSKTFFGNSGTGDFVASTTEYPYIYTDGATETVEVTGKNLFDKNNRERIYGYFPNTGYSWTYNSSAYSNRIPCLPNTTYTARYNGNSSQVVLSFASTSSDRVPTADSQSVSVTNSIRQNSPTIDTPITITTGASDKWLIVAYNVADPQNTDMADNLQIELGSTATTYEPYFNGGQATAQDLYAVGDYKDVQSVLNGAITRNVGIKVLTGAENWLYNSNYARYNIGNFLTNSLATSSFFITHGVSGLQNHNWRILANNTLAFYDDLTWFADATAFKQWLSDQYNSGNPVIVIYPLATATTETVTAQPLTIQEGTNIVEITQASIDNLELEVSYKSTN